MANKHTIKEPSSTVGRSAEPRHWRLALRWLRDDWQKRVGLATAVRLFRKHPRVLLMWLSGLAVAYGGAAAVAAVLHKSWLLSEYGYLPAVLVSASVGHRLYELKRDEQGAAPSDQSPESL